MNRDDILRDILRMAREAGMCEDDGAWFSRSDVDADVTTDDLERFAALVAAAEREACARVCEEVSSNIDGEEGWFAVDCANAIRARGNNANATDN